MRSLLFGTLVGFLLFSVSVVSAVGASKDCVCERNYVGFSVVSIFDGVEFFYVASGKTKEEASTRAMYLISLSHRKRLQNLLILPFSISMLDAKYVDLVVDPDTGKVSASVKANEEGYSVWMQRCFCVGEKIKPKKKKPHRNTPVLNVHFLR